jgi:DnaJ-class molecular chaperone
MGQCQECLGEGKVVIEIAMADWDHGGYIRESLTECPDCSGTGEVEIEND